MIDVKAGATSTILSKPDVRICTPGLVAYC
jgi:hypothetical protein